MQHLDLFSGIGGFSLAVDQVFDGVEHIFCDIDPFCRAVTQKHWPNARHYGDIKEVIEVCKNHAHTVNNLNGQPILTGVKNVSQKPNLTGITEHRNDTKNINQWSEKQPTNSESKLLKPTEENVSVAGKQNHHSLPSTISTEEGQKNENVCLDCSFTGTLGTTDSPKDTDYSVITATTEHTDSENAHTNYERPFLLTAGVPCQPASQAGRRRGKADNRWLWPETFEVIRLVQPKWVILENVRGLLTLEHGVVFQELLSELESLGYEYEAFIIPAVSKNAPHRRDRVWIIGYAEYNGYDGTKNRQSDIQRGHGNTERQDKLLKPKRTNSLRETTSDTERTGYKRQEHQKGQNARHHRGTQSPDWSTNWLEVASRLCGVDARVSYWVDGRGKVRNSRNERLKALGNSIVSQVAIEIMKAIKANP